ncbi:hypothetical protein ACFSTE_16665 [Aquimarina hainanensis]|uniref:Uncharacterized protein n=1 Tax=Aquimarina hainanensis TaxID=1578017 RepID=A0ABW5NA76_9FLAO|nr:hypothetical protein [Aquimarina sp. TRL1]QKX07018.1 hypothetical protein HN014_19560 [Aquimarina sp. TRL1]
MNIKTTRLTSVLLCTYLFISCKPSNSVAVESEIDNIFSNNWQNADLTNYFLEEEITYQLTPEQLLTLIHANGKKEFRIVPGILDEDIYLKFHAIDKKGAITEEEWAKNTIEVSPIAYLNLLQQKERDTIVENMTDTPYRITIEEARKYKDAWYRKKKEEINEITKVNGERVAYFTLSEELVLHLSNLEIDHINISWGINNTNTLVGVLIPIGKDKIMNREDVYIINTPTSSRYASKKI